MAEQEFWKSGLGIASVVGAADEVLADVTHELGLEFLGAEFAADVEGALFLSDVFVPGAEVEDGDAEVSERGPH